MSLQQLSSATVKLITSSQVITSVSSVVKELVENAIDAGAKNINVKIEDNGLGKVEVKDDGRGIQKSDMINVCLPSYTSKISNFADLDSLQSYGFRGEALSSLCQVSDVSITTRTSDDELATVYTMGKHGEVLSTKISHYGGGTQITATNLFKNLPVRKQYLNSGRRASEELKRTESVVKSLAMIHPSLRVTLSHNKCSLWQKTAVASLRLSLMQVVGHAISSNMEELSINENEMSVDLIIPKKECNDIITQSSSESIMLFVNKRPVKYKKLEQIMLKYINEYFDGQIPTRKYPHCLASINVSPSHLDVNLEPNKTKVLFKNEEEVLCCVEKLLSTYYAQRAGAETSNKKIDVESTSPRKHKLMKEDRESKQVCKKPKVMSNEIPETADDLGISAIGDSQNENCCIEPIDNNLEVEEENTAFPKELINKMHETEDSNIHKTSSWNDSLFDLESDLLPLNEDPRKRGFMPFVTHPKSLSGMENNLISDREGIIAKDFNKSSSSISLPCSTEKEPCISDEMWAEIDRAAGWTDAQLAIVNGDISTITNSSKLSSESFTVKSKITAPEPSLKVKTIVHGSKLKENERAHSENSRFSHGTDWDEECEVIKKQNNIPLSKQSSLATFLSPIQERIWDKADDSLLSLDLDCFEAKNGDLLSKPIAVTKEKWSTGNVCSGNGKLIQGSCVLLPNAASSASGQMDQSVSSQMGQKENSAFTKFSREIRPQILQEHPGIAFTKVAALMVNRWRSLKEEEREGYEKMARENDEERKRKFYSPTVPAPLDPRKKHERIEKFQKLLNNSVEACPQKDKTKVIKRKVERLGRKEHHIEISFCTIAEKILQDSIFGNVDFGLIGQLKSGIWLYNQGMEIGVVRHWGLHETVLFDQLLKDHTIPIKRLDNEIMLDEKLMGSEHWKLLFSLEKSYNGLSQHVTITSPIVSKNGFRIEVYEGNDEMKFSCALTGIPSVSRFFGVAELKETLLMLEKNGPEASLDQCRPLKLRYYLEAEAVRIARESPPLDRNSMDELLKYWHTTLAREEYMCLHKKPIFMPIHQLGTIKTDSEDLW